MMVQSYDAIAIESAYQAMAKKQVWAIGEVGLDKRNKAYWDLQISLFQQQIEIANALQKPLIIHCVQAIDVCLLYLKAAQVPVIFHGFRKSLPANAIPSTIVIDSQGYVAARVSGIVTIGSLSTLIERVQSS